MRRGVAVAAHNGGARQREALLRADHMHDTLTLVALMVIFDAEFGGIFRDGLDLNAALLLLDPLGTIRSRHVVIDNRQRLLRRAHLAIGHAQPLERLRRGDFMNQMPVNIEQACAIRLLVDDMISENLVIEGLGGLMSWHSWRAFSLMS